MTLPLHNLREPLSDRTNDEMKLTAVFNRTRRWWRGFGKFGKEADYQISLQTLIFHDARLNRNTSFAMNFLGTCAEVWVGCDISEPDYALWYHILTRRTIPRHHAHCPHKQQIGLPGKVLAARTQQEKHVSSVRQRLWSNKAKAI